MLTLNPIILAPIILMLVLADEEIEDHLHKPEYIFHKDRKQENRRVLGGSPAPATGLSFAVGILNRQKNAICSGSIIAPTFVLTAAHCENMYYVHKAVTDNRSKKLLIYEAQAYIKHPGFSFTRGADGIDKLANDIAILQTKENMIKGWVHAIPLSTASMLNVEGSLGTVAGYGQKGIFSGPDLRNLYYTDLQLAKCPARWTIMICGQTPSDSGKTSALCGGDSGGPMVYNGKLLGINSIGPALCTSYLPETVQSAFTLVSAYVPWIQSQMSNLVGKNKLADSIISMTTARTSIFGAHVSKNLKNHQINELKSPFFEEKITYKNIYYSNQSKNSSVFLVIIYSVLFTNMIF